MEHDIGLIGRARSVSYGTTLGTKCVIMRDRKEMYGAHLEHGLETDMYVLDRTFSKLKNT